eukprot:1323088-Amorphochlora_amoeboformis.AAC.2
MAGSRCPVSLRISSKEQQGPYMTSVRPFKTTQGIQIIENVGHFTQNRSAKECVLRSIPIPVRIIGHPRDQAARISKAVGGGEICPELLRVHASTQANSTDYSKT